MWCVTDTELSLHRRKATHVYTRTQVCVCVCVCACVHVHTRACMCTPCSRMHLHVHACAHTRMHVQAHTHTRMHKHTHTHTHTHTLKYLITEGKRDIHYLTQMSYCTGFCEAWLGGQVKGCRGQRSADSYEIAYCVAGQRFYRSGMSRWKKQKGGPV